ncbi:CBN-FBXC-32 protein [Caenorhabditis brenneri]|uniref:CBN-FBXC-32 protein n=1 Tax=Caenorhabditis brenneri TaxID=135651 RepID=G0N4W2_CAEBE|nr:CBN-FBXC-32 protein [Caenorhabditis brenneri]
MNEQVLKGKPLSYVALTRLLKHIQPEKRFEISRRCPSIRAVELAVPLHINTLYLKELELIVNETSYSLGVQTVFNHPKPRLIKTDRVVQYDVDKYGFKCSRIPSRPDESEFRIDSRNDWNEVKKIDNFTRHFDHFMWTNRKEACERGLLTQPANPELKEDLRRSREGLFYHQFPINEIEPIYTHQIQFKVKNGEKILRVETMAYNESVHDAMKYLVFKMFKGRDTISVDTLKINPDGYHRYPVGLNFRARKLEMFKTKKVCVCPVFYLLDVGSYQLRSITTDAEIIRSSIYDNCDHLYLLKHPANFWELRQIRIHFMEKSFPADKIRGVLHKWQEIGQLLKPFFTFWHVSYQEVNDLYCDLLNEPGAKLRKVANKRRIQQPCQILVPLSNFIEVKFFCKTNRKGDTLKSFNMIVQDRKDVF